MKPWKNEPLYLTLLFISVILILYLSWHFLGKHGLINTIIPAFFGSITVVFAYLGYKYTREKFRHDLFDRRWKIYQNLTTFLSLTLKYGDAPSSSNEDAENFHVSAHESFRGAGLHGAKLLFGDDIQSLFDNLNDTYAWLVAHQNRTEEKAANEWEIHMKFIRNTLKDLPDLFKKYLYFGSST